MSWLQYAIFAQLIYTIVVFIDKYIVSKEVKDYQGLPIFTTFIGFVAGFLFWIFTGFPTLSTSDALIVLGTGILTIWGTYFYFKAISSDESSTVIILMQMIPVVVLILAFIFLNEKLTLFQFLGFLLILVSTTAISLEKTAVKIKLSHTFMDMIIVDIFWAGAAVLIKFAVETNSFSKILPYESWGIGIGGVFLYIFLSKVRRSFHKTLKIIRFRALVIMLSNEVLYIVAKSLTYFAYFLGPVTLVSIISGTQVIFGIIFGVLLTIFLPEFFIEDINTGTIVKKSIFAIIALSGIVLIS